MNRLSLPPDWRLRSIDNGPVAQLDRASHYGCEGLGFESLQGHEEACKSLTCRLFHCVMFRWLGGTTCGTSHT